MNMSKKIKHISHHKRKKKPRTMEESLKVAKQHMRNNNVDGLDEPQGLASGNMDKFINDRDEWDEDDKEDK